MATFSGPSNPADNLVFELDAGNIKSYPGSGSQWFDLANRITMNSQGTQTPFTTKDVFNLMVLVDGNLVE